MSGRSIVEFFPDHSGYKCGYCKGEKTNLSHGMWAHSLTVQDYQDLIDRGWRRSGKYTYKPTMKETCCPQYAIRCDPASFKLSKSQKKVIKCNNKYFSTGVKPGPNHGQSSESEVMNFQDETPECIHGDPVKRKAISVGLNSRKHQEPIEVGESNSSRLENPPESMMQNVNESKQTCDATTSDDITSENKSQKKIPKPGLGADPTKPKCKKAKLLRLERKSKNKSSTSKQHEKSNTAQVKTLQDFIDDIQKDPSHKLEIQLVSSSPGCDQFKKTYQESYELWKKYQMCIHNEELSDCDERSYQDFLVTSPLMHVESKKAGFPGFGSFHQQYLLDGKIIAVGVIDILPHCVSSVYLYYDPDYAFLSLGTYSALREVAFISRMHSLEPSILYYYMGYYIHSCPKMKYKGQYTPSFLLCPETYGWFPMEICSPKLDTNKYSRFDDTDRGDPDAVDAEGLQNVLCLHRRQAMPYFIYRAMNLDVSDGDEVLKYANLTGGTCAKRILLYRATRSTDDDDDSD